MDEIHTGTNIINTLALMRDALIFFNTRSYVEKNVPSERQQEYNVMKSRSSELLHLTWKDQVWFKRLDGWPGTAAPQSLKTSKLPQTVKQITATVQFKAAAPYWWWCRQWCPGTIGGTFMKVTEFFITQKGNTQIKGSIDHPKRKQTPK